MHCFCILVGVYVSLSSSDEIQDDKSPSSLMLVIRLRALRLRTLSEMEEKSHIHFDLEEK